jgi:GT2 family glycosyltransferase
VVVSYGGIADTAKLIDSLSPESVPGTQVVVACNREGDAAEASSALAGLLASGVVRIADFPDNPGYLPAVARVVGGLKRGGHVVFSNADLVAEPGTIRALLAGFEQWPRALALAPSVIGVAGVDVNPHLSAPPSAGRLAVLAALHRFAVVSDLALLRRTGHGSTLPTAGTPGQTLWSGHGCCVALSADFFAKGGDLDYPFKLFGEELWIGAEIDRLGGEVRYIPEARLRHIEHAATGSGRRRGWIARVKYDGLRYWAHRARNERWR